METYPIDLGTKRPPGESAEASKLAAKGKAQRMWAEFTPNQRTGVRFGMFPAAEMRAAEQEGYDGRLLSVALMDCAAADGGMRA
jgi:hypothetical protein